MEFEAVEPLTLLGFTKDHYVLLERYLGSVLRVSDFAMSGRNFGHIKLNNKDLPHQGLLRMFFVGDEGFTIPLADVESSDVKRQLINLNFMDRAAQAGLLPEGADRESVAATAAAVAGRKRSEEDHMLQGISFFLPKDEERDVTYMKELFR